MALYLESPERFGAAVYYLRQKRGLTQADLARRAGVSRITVMKVEQSCSLTLVTALRLLKALGVSLAIAPSPQSEEKAPA